MKALLIAEKPSLMRTIQDEYRKMSYPDDIKFTALVGHVLTLQYPGDYDEKYNRWSLEDLPIIPNDFKYKVNPRTRDVYSDIKRELDSGKYDYVINACDAGREGQLIFYSVYEHLNCKLPVKRFWTADLSPRGVQAGLNNLLDDNNDQLLALRESSKLRSHFDWIQGMNLSRAVSLKTGATISIGRVMTPTLAIVVNRENEIKNFVPRDFFQLEGDFGGYKGLWFDEKTNGNRFGKEDTADKLKKKIMNHGKGVVKEIETKDQRRHPYRLHSLTQLQREANIVYGYTANKTLSIAQELYQDRKLITYPRTDSEYLPANIAAEIPQQLEDLKDNPEYGDYIKEILKDSKNIDNVLKSKRYVDDSKVTDHFAIIPTNVVPNYSKMTPDEVNIYNLIIRRLTAIFMEPQVTSKTVLVTDVGGDLFKTNGSILKTNGFMNLYPSTSKDTSLPNLKKGDEVDLKDIEILKGATTPPNRYTEARLLELMENVGRIIEDEELEVKDLRLGTPATSGDTIDKLIERKYMERKGSGKSKMLYPTEFGSSIIETLDGYDITSPELTAIWEKKLSDIEALKLDPKEFEKEMIDYAKEITDKIVNDIDTDLSKYSTQKGKTEQKAFGKCPKCNEEAILSDKFLRCSKYKDTCEFIISRKILGANITQADLKALIGGKETGEKTFNFKNGKGQAKIKLKKSGDLEFIFN